MSEIRGKIIPLRKAISIPSSFSMKKGKSMKLMGFDEMEYNEESSGFDDLSLGIEDDMVLLASSDYDKRKSKVKSKYSPTRGSFIIKTPNKYVKFLKLLNRNLLDNVLNASRVYPMSDVIEYNYRNGTEQVKEQIQMAMVKAGYKDIDALKSVLPNTKITNDEVRAIKEEIKTDKEYIYVLEPVQKEADWIVRIAKQKEKIYEKVINSENPRETVYELYNFGSSSVRNEVSDLYKVLDKIPARALNESELEKIEFVRRKMEKIEDMVAPYFVKILARNPYAAYIAPKMLKFNMRDLIKANTKNESFADLVLEINSFPDRTLTKEEYKRVMDMHRKIYKDSGVYVSKKQEEIVEETPKSPLEKLSEIEPSSGRGKRTSKGT